MKFKQTLRAVIREAYAYAKRNGFIWNIIITGALQIIISNAITYEVSDRIEKAWDKDPIFVNVIGVATIVALGFLLNLFKKWNQSFYGIVEIFLSVSAAIYVINRYLEVRNNIKGYQDLLGLLVPFVTAVYFNQRGFNNFFDGREKLKLKKEKMLLKG